MNLIQKRNPENDEILSYQCRWYCEASRPTFESSMSMNFNYLLDNLTISSVSKKDRQSSVMIKIFIIILSFPALQLIEDKKCKCRMCV